MIKRECKLTFTRPIRSKSRVDSDWLEWTVVSLLALWSGRHRWWADGYEADWTRREGGSGGGGGLRVSDRQICTNIIDRRASACPSSRMIWRKATQGWNNRTLIGHEPLIFSKMCFTKTEWSVWVCTLVWSFANNCIFINSNQFGAKDSEKIFSSLGSAGYNVCTSSKVSMGNVLLVQPSPKTATLPDCHFNILLQPPSFAPPHGSTYVQVTHHHRCHRVKRGPKQTV